LTNKQKNSPLHISAECDNLEETKAFVEGGAGLNKTSKYGDSPLMLAAYNGKSEFLRFLQK
jgi:ankyrin repeat protein